MRFEIAIIIILSIITVALVLKTRALSADVQSLIDTVLECNEEREVYEKADAIEDLTVVETMEKNHLAIIKTGETIKTLQDQLIENAETIKVLEERFEEVSAQRILFSEED